LWSDTVADRTDEVALAMLEFLASEDTDAGLPTVRVSGTDAYLKSTVDAIMQSNVRRQGRNAIVVTFDEGSTDLGCCDGGNDPTTTGGGRIVTIVIRSHDVGPIRDATPFNHHSLVATLQEAPPG
jgi:hypothetical protein